MEFLVSVPGLRPFRSAPDTRMRIASGHPCRPGELCQEAALTGGCLAVRMVAPALDYFSQVVSHQMVQVWCRDANGTITRVEETGQRAAFRLLTAALAQAPCPFFRRFSGQGASRPATRVDAAYIRLARSLLDEAGEPELPDPATLSRLQATAGRLGREIESHLRPILREAKRRCRRDAAVNAVIMLFSACALTTETLGAWSNPSNGTPRQALGRHRAA